MDAKEIIKEYLEAEEKRLNELISETKSPIEEIFCAAVHTSGFLEDLRFYMGLPDIPYMKSQVKVGRYRADFEIGLPGNLEKISKVLIECDGHEYHHATPEQVSRDGRRDRFLIREGYMVFHISGTEIVNDIDTVLQELTEAIVGFEEGVELGRNKVDKA